MTDFKNVVMNERLYGYMLAQAQPPNAIQAELIARTRALGESAQMQIPHEQAVLLTMLVRLTNAERVCRCVPIRDIRRWRWRSGFHRPAA